MLRKTVRTTEGVEREERASVEKQVEKLHLEKQSVYKKRKM